MTRAIGLTLLFGSSIGWAVVGCGSSSAAPSGEATAPGARPVRIADHQTEAEPAPETIAVPAAQDDVPHADPPPVEPPSFED